MRSSCGQANRLEMRRRLAFLLGHAPKRGVALRSDRRGPGSPGRKNSLSHPLSAAELPDFDLKSWETILKPTLVTVLVTTSLVTSILPS
jgi:hypothetical protein